MTLCGPDVRFRLGMFSLQHTPALTLGGLKLCARNGTVKR